MNKKIKKLNEFRDVEFEIEAETEIKVLSDSEIEIRQEKFREKERENLSNRDRRKTQPSVELFEKMVSILLKEGGTQDDVDNLSIRYYDKPYYKNNDDL